MSTPDVIPDLVARLRRAEDAYVAVVNDVKPRLERVEATTRATIEWASAAAALLGEAANNARAGRVDGLLADRIDEHVAEWMDGAE